MRCARWVCKCLRTALTCVPVVHSIYIDVVNHFGRAGGFDCILERLLPAPVEEPLAAGEAAGDILEVAVKAQAERDEALRVAQAAERAEREEALRVAREAAQAEMQAEMQAALAAARAADDADADADPAAEDAHVGATGGQPTGEGSGEAVPSAAHVPDEDGGADTAPPPPLSPPNLSSATRPGAVALNDTPEMLQLDELAKPAAAATLPTRPADSTLPSLDVVKALVESVANVREVMARPFGLRYVPPLRDCVFALLRRLPAKDMRDMTKDSIKAITTPMRKLLSRFFNHLQRAVSLDAFALDLAFKCFTSEFYNLRLNGFRMILDAIQASTRKNCPWPHYVKAPVLATWVFRRGIIDMVFGGTGDREYIQRSLPFLKFLAQAVRAVTMCRCAVPPLARHALTLCLRRIPSPHKRWTPFGRWSRARTWTPSSRSTRCSVKCVCT